MNFLYKESKFKKKLKKKIFFLSVFGLGGTSESDFLTKNPIQI